ncbi:S-layer homology domain-containing protein [Paenibacillus senegalensis]|uniref:S-layer homology domain-containing protein n=1 Tax=Paenibacillus senegalensis TaxID=1465766 RepID=UPI0002891903|nr:S-layer homology domain-containing protein [Paenibacillus senegalensis]
MKRLNLVISLVLTLCLTAGGIAPAIQASSAEKADYAGHWANETIKKWIHMNMLDGYPDGSIRPDQPITRAEFVVFINRAFGFAAGAANPFHDVDEDDWYAPAVAIAVQAGYVSGYEDHTFRPMQEVSRQEAAQMLHHLLALPPDPAAAASFLDEAELADWSRGAVGAVTAHGIVSGYPGGQFQPERSLSRAEAIVLLDRARETWGETATEEEEEAEAVDERVIIDAAGDTFGPDSGSPLRIAGDVIVAAPDTTLRNLIVEGDVIIAKEVGEGDVDLQNVDVGGTMNVHGGGSESIRLQDSTVIRLIIEKENGAVHIVVSGDTVITETVVYSPALLEAARDLVGEGFQRVTLFGSDMELRFIRAVIGLLHVTEEVSDSVIYLLNGARIIELIMDGKATIIDSGSYNPSHHPGSDSGNEPEPGTGPEPEPGTGPEPEPTLSFITHAPESLSFNGIRETESIRLTAHWSDETSVDVTAEAVWHSDDETVASVTDGIVTAEGYGTTMVWVEYADYTASIPVSVVRKALYADIAIAAELVVAGENIPVTFTVYRSDGSVDSDFNGEKMVTVSGYTNAPSGTAGSFAGTPLIGASTERLLAFTNGKASANLVLHHAAEQTILIDVVEPEDESTPFTITPQPAEPSKLTWKQKPGKVITEDEAFEAIVQVADEYENPIEKLGLLEVQATIAESDTGVSFKETPAANVVDGVVIFRNLLLQGLDSDANPEDVTLRFTLKMDGAELLLDSDSVQVVRFARGAGTEAEPYEIESLGQLANVSKHLDAHFQLNADIDMPDNLEDYNDPGGWIPIGHGSGTGFQGVFDGKGHTISNLMIRRTGSEGTGAQALGLFSTIAYGGEIRNLTLENVDIKSPGSDEDGVAGRSVGSVAGVMSEGSSVTNVTVSGKVEGDSQVGGLVGLNAGTITESSANVMVTGNSAVGGLIGFHRMFGGEVTKSYATGDVNGSLYVGGLIGQKEMLTEVSEVFATGDVAGSVNVGGLIGGSSGTVRDAYATGYVTGDNNVGGLIGNIGGGSTIENAYAKGVVTDIDPSSGTNVGGLIGSMLFGTPTAAYYYQEPDNGRGEKKSESEMKLQTTYEGWKFDTIWQIVEGESFPTFIWQSS